MYLHIYIYADILQIFHSCTVLAVLSSLQDLSPLDHGSNPGQGATTGSQVQIAGPPGNPPKD